MQVSSHATSLNDWGLRLLRSVDADRGNRSSCVSASTATVALVSIKASIERKSREHGVVRA